MLPRRRSLIAVTATSIAHFSTIMLLLFTEKVSTISNSKTLLLKKWKSSAQAVSSFSRPATKSSMFYQTFSKLSIFSWEELVLIPTFLSSAASQQNLKWNKMLNSFMTLPVTNGKRDLKNHARLSMTLTLSLFNLVISLPSQDLMVLTKSLSMVLEVMLATPLWLYGLMTCFTLLNPKLLGIGPGRVYRSTLGIIGSNGLMMLASMSHGSQSQKRLLTNSILLLL
mmetsp:Transcript_29287/g.26763  ORF Transcript_29287/g.26763 Transcript_29287/m.26763 type:complete len:225 (+) Transcript_29287:513-1187(+)